MLCLFSSSSFPTPPTEIQAKKARTFAKRFESSDRKQRGKEIELTDFSQSFCSAHLTSSLNVILINKYSHAFAKNMAFHR